MAVGYTTLHEHTKYTKTGKIYRIKSKQIL